MDKGRRNNYSKTMRFITEHHRNYNKNALKKLIDKYDYISFDVFDTLIRRTVATPRQIPVIVANEFAKRYGRSVSTDFKELRTRAIMTAHETADSAEVTFDEIYDIMRRIVAEEHLNISEEDIQNLRNIEIETEIDCCSLRKDMKDIYDHCIESGKTVILNSDMYLQAPEIKMMLDHVGITGYKKLFVSADYRLRKSDSTLFRKVAEELGIDPKQMLHIGDTYQGDVFMARKAGMKAFFLARNNVTMRYPKIDDVTSEDYKTYRNFAAFLDHTVDPYASYEYRTGYEEMGPFVLGYSRKYKTSLNELVENIDSVDFSAYIDLLSEKGCNIEKLPEYIESIRHNEEVLRGLKDFAADVVSRPIFSSYLKLRSASYARNILLGAEKK